MSGHPVGAIAQLGEHLLCKQGVAGSIPAGSTSTSVAWIVHTLLKPPGSEAKSVFLENSGCDKCLDSLLSQDVSLRQVSETSLGTCNTLAPPAARKGSRTGVLGLYGQVTKRIRWMPWRSEAMKDVAACEKYRGAGNKL